MYKWLPCLISKVRIVDGPHCSRECGQRASLLARGAGCGRFFAVTEGRTICAALCSPNCGLAIFLVPARHALLRVGRAFRGRVVF